MAIKPVEYVKDSSTSGFAVAGDQKTITKDNANTIRKDADQGNTKDLDNAQEKFLDNNVDYDNLDYSTEEMGKVGEQQIDTEGEDGEDLSEKDGGKGGAATATAVSATSAAAGAAAAISAATGANIADGFTALVLGIATSLLSGTTLALSFPSTFDPNLGERKSQTGAAGDNNAIIQQYIDTLNSDMDMMNEDVTMYQELSAVQTQAQVETITDLGSMQAELQVYQAQGNTEKVAEIKAQMEEVKKTSEEDSKGPQEEMDGLKENIETYTGNNAEATGVKTSGDTVSEFLKAGEPMGKMAKASSYMSAIAGLACIAVTPIPKIWAAFIPVDGPASVAAKVLFVAAGLSFGVAAKNFNSRSSEESAAADAGEEMAGNLANLQANIDGQAGYTEATSGTYGEADEAATETIEKNQESTDKANGKGKNQKTKAKKEDEDEKPVATPAPTPTPAPATAAA